jgi:hypothetical protein
LSYLPLFGIVPVSFPQKEVRTKLGSVQFLEAPSCERKMESWVV